MRKPLVRKEDVAEFKGTKLASVILQLVVGAIDLSDAESDLMGITKGQRALYLISLLDGEVCNGGLHQYFSNFAGDFASLTTASLQLVGAVEAAHILREAMKRFPEGRPSSDREERNCELNQISLDTFHDLDTSYFALKKTEQHPWAMAVHFLEANLADFIG